MWGKPSKPGQILEIRTVWMPSLKTHHKWTKNWGKMWRYSTRKGAEWCGAADSAQQIWLKANNASSTACDNQVQKLEWQVVHKFGNNLAQRMWWSIKHGSSFAKVMFLSLNFNCTCDISCAQSEFDTVDHKDCATTHNSCMHYQSNSSKLHIFEMDQQ